MRAQNPAHGAGNPCFFFSSRRRHTRLQGDWSSDVCSSDLKDGGYASPALAEVGGTKMLICFAGKHLVAMNPKDGKTIWELEESWEIEYDINEIGRASCRERV